jgi:multimeric flavodoxin WrbA
MSKNILILNGSPRKGGNSDLLCGKLTEGALESGHAVRQIYLQDCTIGGCRACYACQKTGSCIQKDDMGEILAEMKKADVLVLASPVYFYSVSAQMKLLIDRTLPDYLKLEGKEFVFVVTSADGEQADRRAMDALYGLTDCVPKAKIVGTICGTAWKKGEVVGTAAMDEAYALGKQL